MLIVVLEIPALSSFCPLGATEEGKQTWAACLPQIAFTLKLLSRRDGYLPCKQHLPQWEVCFVQGLSAPPQPV